MIEEQRWAARAENSAGSRSSRGRRRRASCALSATAAGGVPSSAAAWRTHPRRARPSSFTHTPTSSCERVDEVRATRGEGLEPSAVIFAGRVHSPHPCDGVAESKRERRDARRGRQRAASFNTPQPRIEPDLALPLPASSPASRSFRQAPRRRMGGRNNPVVRWPLAAPTPGRRRGTSCPSSSSGAIHIGIHIRHPRRTHVYY